MWTLLCGRNYRCFVVHNQTYIFLVPYFRTDCHSSFLFRFHFEHLHVVRKNRLLISISSFFYIVQFVSLLHRVNCTPHRDTIFHIPPITHINSFIFCPIRCQKYVSPQLDLRFVFIFVLQLFWSLNYYLVC